MAWIESHQTLRDHPKVARLARLLDEPQPHVIGHLHFLWWWALDHAEDGDVSDFDAMDLADAAGWAGDPEVFVKALIECGPGRRDGLLVQDGSRLLLHDWWDYAGKLVSRRKADRERKAKERGTPSDLPVQRTSDGHDTESAVTPYVTEQNRTEPIENPRADVAALCSLLVDLMVSNGCRRPTISKAWQDAARRLIDLDKIEPAEAERVMRWALTDDFWKGNVHSMPTFRKQFDRLRIQSTNGNGHRPSRNREVVTAFKAARGIG